MMVYDLKYKEKYNTWNLYNPNVQAHDMPQQWII